MKTLDITKINESFRAIAPRMAEFLDPETVIKECNFAMQIFNRNPYLSDCTPESKLQAVLNVAQIGLTLNPVMKYAYLVPRYNSQTGKRECYLEPSYIGLAKLVTDTGSATHLNTQLVYEGDLFENTLSNDNEPIKHSRKFLSKKVLCVYSVATLSTGKKIAEIMDMEDVYNVRARSESFKTGKSCPWTTDEGEMTRKTVVKRLTKYIPKTEQWGKLAAAVDLDNSDYPATEEQMVFIESLLLRANLDERETSGYYRELQSTISSARASYLIEHLQANQVDAISSGHGYGQREITGKLKAEIDAPKETGELFKEQTKTE